ncbi:pneumococcal serine-rich repeat protein-like [Clytia hemisphaerica]|uniref:pneumococcal serine-rich repeat protein-like n=1 Tax=Clytia hemisphaerica TaxID=252671 RepID=UPI0034D4E5F5
MMEPTDQADLTASKSFSKEEVEPRLHNEQTATSLNRNGSNTTQDQMGEMEKALSQHNQLSLNQEEGNKTSNVSLLQADDRTPTAQQVYDMVHSADNIHISSTDGKKRRLVKRSLKKKASTVVGSASATSTSSKPTDLANSNQSPDSAALTCLSQSNGESVDASNNCNAERTSSVDDTVNGQQKKKGNRRRNKKSSPSNSVEEINNVIEKKSSMDCKESEQACGSENPQPKGNILSKIAFFEERRKVELPAVDSASPSDNTIVPQGQLKSPNAIKSHFSETPKDSQKQLLIQSNVPEVSPADTMNKPEQLLPSSMDKVPVTLPQTNKSTCEVSQDTPLQPQLKKPSYADMAMKPAVKPILPPKKVSVEPSKDVKQKTSKTNTENKASRKGSSKESKLGRTRSDARKKSSNEFKTSSEGVSKKAAYFNAKFDARTKNMTGGRSSNSKRVSVKDKPFKNVQHEKIGKGSDKKHLPKRSSTKCDGKNIIAETVNIAKAANLSKNNPAKKKSINNNNSTNTTPVKIEHPAIKQAVKPEAELQKPNSEVKGDPQPTPQQSTVEKRGPSYADMAKKPAVIKPAPPATKKVDEPSKDLVKKGSQKKTTKTSKKVSYKEVRLVKNSSNTTKGSRVFSKNTLDKHLPANSVGAKAAFFDGKNKTNGQYKQQKISKKNGRPQNYPKIDAASSTKQQRKRGKQASTSDLPKKVKLSDGKFAIKSKETENFQRSRTNGKVTCVKIDSDNQLPSEQELFSSCSTREVIVKREVFQSTQQVDQQPKNIVQTNKVTDHQDASTEALNKVTDHQDASTEARTKVTDHQEASPEAPNKVTDHQDATTEAPNMVTDHQDATTEAPNKVTGHQEASPEAPNKVTDHQDATTEAPNKVTDHQDATTETPNKVTDYQDATTEAPNKVTDHQDATTEAPNRVTDHQDASAEAPNKVTDHQDASAEAPNKVTDHKEASTEAPNKVTDHKEASTEAPNKVTDHQEASPEEPSKITDHQDAKTEATTEAPNKVTDHQDATTEAPNKVTDHQDATTEAPNKVTDDQDASTEAPNKVTDHQNATTEAPNEVTDHKETSTEAPNKVTDHQDASTEAPSRVTDHQEASPEESSKVTDHKDATTEAPNKVTDHKEASTEAPNKVTDHQDATTEAPNKVTDHQDATTEATTEAPNKVTDHQDATTEASNKATDRQDATTEATTEAPNKVADHQDATTEAPNKVTDHQDASTEAPNKVTDHKEASIEAPNKVTDHKEASTEAPNKVTDRQDATTEAPNKVTDHQEPSTEAPNKVTDHQEPLTDHQEPSTEAPNKVTDHQDATTEAPNKVTDHQEPSTDHQEPSTEAPNKVTDHQDATTEAPNKVTDHQDATIEAPNKATDHQEPSTEAPNKVTDPKEASPEATSKVTDHQEPSTEAPNKVTDHQDATIKAPNKATDHQEPSTEAPNKVTDPQEASPEATSKGMVHEEVLVEMPNNDTKQGEIVVKVQVNDADSQKILMDGPNKDITIPRKTTSMVTITQQKRHTTFVRRSQSTPDMLDFFLMNTPQDKSPTVKELLIRLEKDAQKTFKRRSKEVSEESKDKMELLVSSSVAAMVASEDEIKRTLADAVKAKKRLSTDILLLKEQLSQEKRKTMKNMKENVIMAIRNKLHMKGKSKSALQMEEKQQKIRTLEKELLDKIAILKYMGVDHEHVQNEHKEVAKADKCTVRSTVNNNGLPKAGKMDSTQGKSKVHTGLGAPPRDNVIQNKCKGRRPMKSLSEPWVQSEPLVLAEPLPPLKVDEVNATPVHLKKRIVCEFSESLEESVDLTSEIMQGHWVQNSPDKDMNRMRKMNAEISEINCRYIKLRRNFEAVSNCLEETKVKNQRLKSKYETAYSELQERDAERAEKKKRSLGRRFRKIFGCASARSDAAHSSDLDDMYVQSSSQPDADDMCTQSTSQQ